MLFFEFAEDARWNAAREAVEFTVILRPYEGTVRVPKRSFQGAACGAFCERPARGFAARPVTHAAAMFGGLPSPANPV